LTTILYLLWTPHEYNCIGDTCPHIQWYKLDICSTYSPKIEFWNAYIFIFEINFYN